MKPKPTPKADLATQARRLREDTCRQLGLDPAKLSAGDELVVSRAGALRLLISDLEAQQLAGRPIDVGKYVEASEALERIVRVDRRAGVGEDGVSPGLRAAREKMAQLLDVILDETPDEARAREYAERAALEAEVEKLRLEVAELKGQRVPPAPQPAARPASENVVPMRHDPPRYLRPATPEPRAYQEGAGGFWAGLPGRVTPI
jgi:hypothetical protein